jgi:hypothetical protein
MQRTLLAPRRGAPAGKGPRRRLSVALLISFLAALLSPASFLQGADEPSTRAKVARRKALFIEQFTRLIEWPPAALPKDRPFVLCIQGGSDTADELTKLASFRKFKERPCDVRRLVPGADLQPCHVLYVAASEAPRLSQTLAAVADKPVLTVGDTAGFVERGVHFNLFEETRSAPQQGTYVNFELSVPAVKRSVLVFDPRLLSTGRRVETMSPPDGKPRRSGP